MSAALYRYPVFLKEDDWTSAVAGFEKRVRRFRSAARLDQVGRVGSAIVEAEADSYPDGDEVKYVLYLTEEDFSFFVEGVNHARNGVPGDVGERVAQELSMAAGDAREL
ncbi:hypothetical protein AB0E08_03695 [Streptomyces sp. NPDC048281]|uniref:hypothetical protein n=1 Tax=Streptomyces sp. NPDC048281 TaxID=3154715 RepID=UPI003424695A